jgi:pseudouridine-5'-phosphate glycosidase
LIVTCAGVKSILDVAATRELLDTLGVLVLGWRTDAFPMFYTAGRSLAVDARVQSAVDVAEVWRAHRALEMQSALLLGVPVPDYAALQEADLEGAIVEALGRAATEGIQGKDVTPFLLRDLVQRTGGASLEANVALLLNNAGVAAEVALELALR